MFALELVDPGPVVDLLFLVAFGAFWASLFFVVAWVSVWLIRPGDPSRGQEDGGKVEQLRSRVKKYLVWSIGTFFYCAAILAVILFFIRLIRWHLLRG